MTKEVYNPKEHTENDKNVGSKGKTKAKAKASKPEKKDRTPKINKYGFLHVDKDLAKHLGVELGKDKEDVPVSVERIPGGFIVKLAESQPT